MKKEKFDLILLDVNLPDGDGFVFAKESVLKYPLLKSYLYFYKTLLIFQTLLESVKQFLPYFSQNGFPGQ